MLSLIYLVIVFILGDSICRRFFTFASIPHRLAAAFLSGLLISTWWTYLSALLFYWTPSPLLWGNLVFFITSIAFLYWLRTRSPNKVLLSIADRSSTGFKKWDWIVLGLVFVMACVLMFATLGMRDGNILIGTHQSSDFGSTLSIIQSFARGHNFPTQFPHFPGERIRYHFLFYFQAGNLEYLGFSPAFANNVLAILSMTAMLILVMTLGALVFGSRVVGRIGASLFFFHGTLSFYPFFASHDSVSAVVDKLLASQAFLPSAFDYRGESWGVWSQVVYANQRHLASSIGIFLLVLTFLIIRYRAAEARAAEAKAAEERAAEARAAEARAAEEARVAEEVRAAEAAAIENNAVPPAENIGSDSAESMGNEVQPITAAESVSPFESEAEEKPVFAEALDAEDTASDTDVLELDKIEQPSEGQATFKTDISDRENFAAEPDLLEIDDIDREMQTGGSPTDSAATHPGVAAEGKEFPVAEAFERDIEPEKPKKVIKPRKTAGEWLKEGLDGIPSFIFAGILLGLMPLWNGAIFVTAFAVIAVLFVLYPQRRQLIGLGIAAVIFALPQVYYLKGGGMPDPGYSLLHWGYTLGNPSIMEVLKYLGFTFGFKWLLLAIALAVGTCFQRKLMIAITSLIFMTFCLQFSLEVLTNHKFLNVWVVLANLFVAYGLWYLWNLRILKTYIVSRILAIALTILVTLSGVIDLFPFYTTGKGETPYRDDELIRWVSENTDPNAVFLTPRWSGHRILLAGRRLFHGHPYYAWSAGYDTHKRDRIYVRMFESTNPTEVFELLKENNISYVAIDNDFRRKDEAIKKLNEAFFKAYCDVVFGDEQNRYGKLTIYKVPDELGQPKPEVELPPEEPRAPIDPNAAVLAFKGGEGNSPGKFVRPRGIAADGKGNFYVADTGNNRIQKFDADGKFLSVFGDPGEREGRMKEPNGIAIDAEGDIYVTDAHNHKLLKFNPDGTFVKEYFGPDTGFYGPRDVVIGPNKQAYVVDQGRTRIGRLLPVTETFSRVWGTAGSGEGEFKEPTGVAIGDNLVFVADLGNGRIQVFDLEGSFVRQWEIPTWGRTSSEFPDAVFDEQTKTLYVTSGPTNEVLAFDVNGTPLKGFNSQGDEKLGNPTSVAILEANKKRWLLVVNTASHRVSRFELEAVNKTEAANKTNK